MQIRTSTALALVLGLGLALPAQAQQAAEAVDADADGDGFVTAEEAEAHSERRFDEIAEGGEGITLEQLQAAIPGAETVGAEAETGWDPETEFEAADSDGDGEISREEWMTWRTQRFEQAAGEEGQVPAGLYVSIDTGGPMTGVDAGGEGDVGVSPAEAGILDPEEARPEDAGPAEGDQPGEGPDVPEAGEPEAPGDEPLGPEAEGATEGVEGGDTPEGAEGGTPN